MKQKRLKELELEKFHESMAMLLDTCLPLPEGIRRFASDIRNKKFRTSLYQLAGRLEEGESLSKAMSGEKRFFPPDYTAMIKIGEQGGRLSEALNLAIDHERFQHDFKESFKNVMVYPSMVFMLVCAGYVFMILYIYPVFMDCFQMTNTEFPGLAMMVQNLFMSAGRYAPLIVVILTGLVFVLRGNIRMSIHAAFLKTPLLGKVMTERFITSFSQGMSILLERKIAVPESLGFLAGITDNKYIASSLEKAEKSAREGTGLETLLDNMGLFPDLYMSAFHTGLKTGTLPECFSNLATIYRSETEHHSRLFLRIMEIVLILFAGIWVAVFGISFFTIYMRFIDLLDYTIKW